MRWCLIKNTCGQLCAVFRRFSPFDMCRFRFQSRDELVPWTVKGGNGAEDGEVLRRYCHLFEEGEMRRICEGVQGIKLEGEYWDASNWCVVFTRC